MGHQHRQAIVSTPQKNKKQSARFGSIARAQGLRQSSWQDTGKSTQTHSDFQGLTSLVLHGMNLFKFGFEAYL
jgi:hypothetical protein